MTKLRQGRRVGQHLYHQQGPEPSDTDRKLPALAYIDDRALHFTGWRKAMHELTARGYDAPMITEEPR